jgi:alanine racemase
MGAQGEGEVTADELADLVGTIPYEILTHISARVPRVYVEKP